MVDWIIAIHFFYWALLSVLAGLAAFAGLAALAGLLEVAGFAALLDFEVFDVTAFFAYSALA